MHFSPYYERFPDQETTALVSVNIGDRSVILMELYCHDKGCDCRRVVLKVYSTPVHKEMGQINFGWEPKSFYKSWASFPMSDAMLNELKGPSIQRLAPPNARAIEALEIVRLAVTDPKYVEQLQRNYKAFRMDVDGHSASEVIEAQSLRTKRLAKRRQRRGRSPKRT